MEVLIGMACRDFALVATDMSKLQSIIVMKNDDNKMYNLSENMVMAVCGESGDTTQFAEYISKNIQLYKMRNGYDLSPNAAASFTRRNLADYLRSRTPYHVNLLLAGRDKVANKYELFFCDYLASMVKVPFACHGYGGFFCTSILDEYYREDMTIEEGYDILIKCVSEVHKRLIVNLPNFKVRVITKDGIKDLDPITSLKLARSNAE